MSSKGRNAPVPIIYRRKHVYVCQNTCKRTGKTYFTIVNDKNNTHAHCDNRKGAILICRGAAELRIRKHETRFIRAAIKKII